MTYQEACDIMSQWCKGLLSYDHCINLINLGGWQAQLVQERKQLVIELTLIKKDNHNGN